jgi:hypothetical protein
MNFLLYGGIVLCLVLFAFLHSLLHECGHALGAWVAGKRVIEIRIGSGARSCGFRIGRTRVRITSWPFGGFTIVCAGTARRYRLRQWIFHIAGPLLTIALITAAFVCRAQVIEPPMMPGNRSLLSGQPLPDALMAFGLTGSYLLLFSLIPQSWTTSDGIAMHSDGRQLLLLPTFNPQQVRECFIYEQGLYAVLFFPEGNRRRDRWLRGLALRTHRHGPDGWALSITARWTAVELPEPAVQFLRRLLDDEWTSKPSENWARSAHVFAYLPLLQSRPDLLPEATTHMRRVVDAFPDALYRATFAALLFESGAHDEARPLFDQVLANPAGQERAIASAYLATDHARLGQTERARQLRDDARRLDAGHPVVQRLLQNEPLRSLA